MPSLVENPDVTVIVPVRNEGSTIQGALACLEGNEASYEAIVIDGASSDETSAIVAARAEEDRRIRLVSCAEPLTRAQAMNRGIEGSRGRVLLFLHADCRLPPGALDSATQAVDAGNAGGGFLKRYDTRSPGLRFSEWGLNQIRTRGMRRLVGTNAMFCSRMFIQELGGFPDLPLLEDVWLSDHLRSRGSVAILPGPVTVSARKYVDDGPVRRTLRNMGILFRYRCLRTDPEILAELYRRPAP